MRFANHSSRPNLQPRVMFVNGEHRIGMYAREDIFGQAELFFDYGYDREIKSEHLHKQALLADWMADSRMANRVRPSCFLPQPSATLRSPGPLDLSCALNVVRLRIFARAGERERRAHHAARLRRAWRARRAQGQALEAAYQGSPPRHYLNCGCLRLHLKPHFDLISLCASRRAGNGPLKPRRRRRRTLRARAPTATQTSNPKRAAVEA